VNDTFRLTKPSRSFSWTIFALEGALLFLWPLIALYRLGNIVIATTFLLMAVFAFLRRYMNPATALQEVGTMKKANRKHDDQDWRRESRVSSILDDVTVNRARRHWMLALALILVAFLVLCFLTISATNNTNSDGMPEKNKSGTEIFLSDFEYLPDQELSYPTCRIGKELSPTVNETNLVDFAFLALLAYDIDSVQLELNTWFGTGVAVDMIGVVNQYRNETGALESPVSYKLIKINDAGPAIVTIRGTAEVWDLFADAQLWSTAALMQVLRYVVPLGGTWTPIMDQLIRAITTLQSSTLERISFYKETTAFVKFLQQSSNIEDGLFITGHSLGGGLAIITGAQTGQPAIAMSGPNALLSRRTFQPKLSEDALNRFTFNVIPDRDMVPRVDDVARLKQNIRCSAPMNSVFGCHAIERTLCELMVSCGTQGRPAICRCAKDYGYPEPNPTGNRTFAEACSSWSA